MNQYLHFLMEQIKGNIKDKLISVSPPPYLLFSTPSNTKTHTHT